MMGNAPDSTNFLNNEYGYIYSVAFRLTADPDRAQDLAQNTAISAWRNISSLRDVSAIKGWLKKICINEFLMAERKKSGVREYSLDELSDLSLQGEKFQVKDSAPSIEEEIIADETIRELRDGCFMAMTRKLTLDQRITFSLIDMFELSVDEVASLMKLSVSAIKGLLHRARTNIFNFFSDKCEWVEPSNFCKCKTWNTFAGDVAFMREEIARREKSLDFREEPVEKPIPEIQKEKILMIYRNMPDRKPSEEWYQKVIDTVKKFN